VTYVRPSDVYYVMITLQAINHSRYNFNMILGVSIRMGRTNVNVQMDIVDAALVEMGVLISMNVMKEITIAILMPIV